jgi:hypothetical protein
VEAASLTWRNRARKITPAFLLPETEDSRQAERKKPGTAATSDAFMT